MHRRTTLEIDVELLARAQATLGLRTMRATVEEALRRVPQQGEDEAAERSRLQREYFGDLPARVDLDVLESDRMWR